jgi:hypothetical protein
MMPGAWRDFIKCALAIVYMLQANRLFQPRFEDKKGQRGKGNGVKGKETLFDLRPYCGNAAAGPCASAVVSAMRAHPDAEVYIAYDPNETGIAMCMMLVRGGSSLSSFAESISAHALGKEYTVPGYMLGFFAFDGTSLEKAMQSCCTIPIPGVSAASCGDESRESLAGALYIAMAKARVFIPFRQLVKQ